MGQGWSLTDHACRFCGSRILERGGTFRCATCGEQATGKVAMICGCGMATGQRAALAPKLKRGTEAQRPRAGGGFMCAANPDRHQHGPAEIVIVFGGAPPTKGTPC